MTEVYSVVGLMTAPWIRMHLSVISGTLPFHHLSTMLLTKLLQGSENYPFQLVFPGMQSVKWEEGCVGGWEKDREKVHNLDKKHGKNKKVMQITCCSKREHMCIHLPTLIPLICPLVIITHCPWLFKLKKLIKTPAVFAAIQVGIIFFNLQVLLEVGLFNGIIVLIDFML